MDCTHLFDKTFTHKRPAGTADGQGGFTKAPLATIGTIDGFEQVSTFTEQNLASGLKMSITNTIYTHPGNTSIQKEDVLELGSRSFRVMVILRDKPVYTKLLCQES